MKTIQLLIAIITFPLSIWYAVGVAVRNLLFNMGIRKTETPEIPTIGIGNLRMGGTGKTPHTEYLIRLLQNPSSDTNRVALLSRGYGRKTKGFLLADKESEINNSELIGDEPAMMVRKFPDLTVAVCEKRAEGVRRLAQLPHAPQIVLLDDVYQHRSVKPTLSILLTEYSDIFSKDHILPFGNLREFRSGSRRADIVVVTKCPPAMSETKRNHYRGLLKLQPQQKLFFSRIVYMPFLPLFNDMEWKQVKTVLLVTGIAHSAPLKDHLEKQCSVKQLAFPDHHDFTSVDCRLIAKTFQSIKESSKAVVTTEKDAMRLQNTTARELLAGLPVFYIPIQISIIDGETFNLTIKKFV